MPLAPLSAGFQSLPPLPTSKLGPSGADSQVGGLCTFWDPVGLSNELSCEAGSFSSTSTPTDVFSQRFEALFPCAGTLGCTVCLAPHLFLLVYLHADVEPPGLPAASLPALALQPAALLQVLSVRLPVSTPPTRLGECFFFNSLVVRLIYSSIFWQFWLVFCF